MGGAFDLVIFDCDGTLVDTEYPNNKALCEVLAAHGFPQYDLDYAMIHYVGKTISDIFLRIRMEHGYVFPHEAVRQVIVRSNELYMTELRAVTGALAVLENLKGRLPFCVASNGERQSVLSSLALAGILDHHVVEEHVFTKNQVARGKPAPDLFLFAAEKMGGDPARCLVVEDSVAGVTAGVAAGMAVMGFTGTAHDRTAQEIRLKDAGAAPVSADIIHILNLLGD